MCKSDVIGDFEPNKKRKRKCDWRRIRRHLHCVPSKNIQKIRMQKEIFQILNCCPHQH